MKNHKYRVVTLIAVITMFTISMYADTVAYSKIIEQRDAILSKILTEQQKKFEVGKTDDESVFSAQIALYSFRRDTNTKISEKIKNQELILAIYEKKFDNVKNKFEHGLVGEMDKLKANDALLQENQILEELKLNKKNG